MHENLDNFDDDGYPAEEALERIARWDAKTKAQRVELLKFVHSLWAYADAGYWSQEGEKYFVSTAGWSGNESLIQALAENTIFWLMCWQQSRRGGHYIFEDIQRP